MGGLVALLLGFGLGAWLIWLGLIFTLFCLFFFRDPERIPPPRPGLFLAPADGRVVSVAPAVPPPELGLGTEPRWRVSIFLSVLNVHVNRVPADGVVTRIAYRHGAFVSASLDKASESNERNALAIRLPNGQEIAVVQIAGLIARRILCSVRRRRSGDRRRALRHHPLRQPHGPVPARRRASAGCRGPDDDRRRNGDRGAAGGMSGHPRQVFREACHE